VPCGGAIGIAPWDGSERGALIPGYDGAVAALA